MARPMNGRGRGRGHGKGRYQSNERENKEDQKSDEKSQQLFNVGTAKNASNFVAMKKECINTFKIEQDNNSKSTKTQTTLHLPS